MRRLLLILKYLLVILFHMLLYAATRIMTVTKPQINVPEMTNIEDQIR
jgi:hypothetical protein